MNEDRFPVVVVGAGLAGLTAAAHLAHRGVPTLVLEADSRWLGGRLSGGDDDSFVFQDREWHFAPDQGMHALWGGYVNMRAVIAEFTDIKLNPSNGEAWINRWGRQVRALEAGNAIRSPIIPAPFHYLNLLLNPRIWRTITPLDFLSIPGFLFSMMWAVSYDPLMEKSRLEGLGMKEFFRGWTPNLRATFTGLGVNLLAAPPESISLSSFIAALRFYTVLRHDSWQLEYFPDSPASTFLPQLVDRIEAADGMVQMGATVLSLDQVGDGWQIRFEDARFGGIRSIEAEHVILAVDPPAAERILKTGESTNTEAQNIKFPSALRNAVIRLWFDTAPPPGTPGGMFTGDFVADNFFWLHRIYSPFKQWHQETGGSAIEVHIYGSEKLMDQSDQHLLILAVNDVQYAFPTLKDHFVHGAVRRNIRTQTEFRIPDAQSLHLETPWPHVFACGDWIGYPSPAFWMERATVTGIAAANKVLERLDHPTFRILEPPPPELLAHGLGAFGYAIRAGLNPLINSVRRHRKRVE